MIPGFDEASYQEGRAAFAAGGSIRSIIEQIVAADENVPFEEAKALSGALGFADALLDLLRQRPDQARHLAFGAADAVFNQS